MHLAQEFSNGALENESCQETCGYAYARDRYVIMETEELEQLRPARDKALVLEHFVPVGDIDPTFYAVGR